MKGFILFLFLFPIAVFGQSSFPKQVHDSIWNVWRTTSNPDTLRLQALKEISGKGYVFTMPDSAFYFAKILYDFAKSKGQKKYMADALNIQGVSCYYRGEYTDAIDFYKRSLKIREAINHKKGIADCLNNIGSIYTEQGEYDKSVQYYLRSLKIKEQINDSLGVAASYNNIGLVYAYQKEYKQAIIYYQKSLRISTKLQNKKLESSALVNMGVSCEESGDYEKAIQYYKKSLQLREEIGDLQGIAVSLNNLGNIYFDQKQFTKAQENYLQSLEIHESMDDKKGISNTLINVGNIYAQLGSFDEALKCYLKSFKIAQEIGVLIEVRDASLALSVLYKKLNRHKESLEMYEVFISTRDSILSEQNQKEVIRQQFKYSYEKQAAADSVKRIEEKKIKEALIAKQKAELNMRKIQHYMLFGGLALVVLFALFTFNRYKVTKSQNKIIEHQKNIVQEKNREITDSITYAKRIQNAMLPSEKYVKTVLPESFIYYKPKDIVAGDFYWMFVKDDIVLLAVADCTGHGVPGAMVSVICNNGLNRSVREYGLTEPGEILDRTRELVIAEFEKSDEDVKDGMDISLIQFQRQNNGIVSVKWSGANNPLWVIRNGVLNEYKANKQPIGKFANATSFKTHKIEVVKGDQIYLFTDGFQDQFGGVKGKKFKASNFKELLVSLSNKGLSEQSLSIDLAMNNWMSNHEQNDDICVIGVGV